MSGTGLRGQALLAAAGAGGRRGGSGGPAGALSPSRAVGMFWNWIDCGQHSSVTVLRATEHAL